MRRRFQPLPASGSVGPKPTKNSHGRGSRLRGFLREWTNERIWPMGDLLDDRDRQYMVERRATELMQAAKEKGFAHSLTKTVTGYGGVTAYVKHLFWEAEFRDDRSRCR